MRTSHSVHVKFHAAFLLALIMTHLKCCFIQIRVHPLLHARRYSSCQEREHWHANLTGHDRMFLASQRQQIEAVHEATSLSWPRGIFYYRIFLYLGFLQALLLDITDYLRSQNIPRGQRLLHERIVDLYILNRSAYSEVISTR